MSLLIRNIKSLVGVDQTPPLKRSGREMSSLNVIENAFLLVEGDLIKDFGSMKDLKSEIGTAKSEIDAEGKFVIPSYCDSHTHLVYASSREQEFADRINGLTYQEIAERGGGILNSVARLRIASEEDLYHSAWARLDEMMKHGTGSVEIKSGYGLDTASELKMLRVIKRLRENHPLTIRSTFLGAHAVPAEFKNNKQKYMDLLIHEMIPKVADEKLADYCDVFCEDGYFSKAESVKILEAAKKHGMTAKVHAEQLGHAGGIEAGVETAAISVDHLEYCNDHDIEILRNSNVMPTILPGAQFFLQLPFPPARKMIDAGLPVAIASDYNPGSSPSGNMNTMVALACIQYKMTPEESFSAATINSAFAMGLSSTHGSIAKGKKANLFITGKIPSLAYIPYSYGSNPAETIIVNGKIQSLNI
jgi:imidazolonepropionase